MALRFTYDRGKDAWNLSRASRSVNHPQVTDVEAAYIAEYGSEFEPTKVEVFIESYVHGQGIDLNSTLVRVEQGWRAVEEAFTARATRLFATQLDLGKLTAYLTIDRRCAYNIEGGFFFVSVHGGAPNKTIMHELLHFYTWHAFGQSLVGQGLPGALYNDIKEALTELLNVAFVDLLGDVRDKGYPQHAALRADIRERFSASQDVRRVVAELLPQLDLSRRYELAGGPA